MRDDTLTERQWWQRAKRHEKWLAHMGEQLEAIGTAIKRANDAVALQRGADRARAISKRIAQLQRVMQRHFQRAPRMQADGPTGHLIVLSSH